MERSHNDTDERLSEEEFSVQDFTVMKLMEEIVEYD